jgi:hypothetical protein
MATQKRWTFCLDESGRFDADERLVLLVGGVLFPGTRDALDAKRRLEKHCPSWPPHATEIRDDGLRSRLLRVAAEEVRAIGGRWLYVCSRPSAKAANAVAAYVEMLGAIVDLAARLAAHEGCQHLGVLPAQRTTPFAGETEVRHAELLGLGRREGSLRGAEEIPFRAWVEGEVRQVFDALAREDKGALPPFPALAEVEVLPASSAAAPTGIVYADLGCNSLYRAIRDGVPPFASPDELLLLHRNDLAAIRRVDRRLRETPPDLHGGARAVTTLQARRSGEGDIPLVGDGAHRTAQLLWERAHEMLGNRISSPHATHVAHALAGAAFAALAAKTGDYEGTWKALVAGWSGEGALAQKLRTQIPDRELAARLWRCTFECANHRGDVSSTARAKEEFDRVVGNGGSLVLVAEDLAVRNLASVALQNLLPSDAHSSADIRARLVADAEELRRIATDAGSLVALAARQRPGSHAPSIDAAEAELWRALGREPDFGLPDRERGRVVGTAARSLAFAGQLHRSASWLLEARSFFAEPFDLTFNASVLARVLLEGARVEERCEARAIAASLERAGAELEPHRAAKLTADAPAVRFTVDLVARAMLWAPAVVKHAPRWREATLERGSGTLYEVLSTQRSHPTELVARHLAELARSIGDESAAADWFRLSLAVSNEAEPGSAIARFWVFTRILADNAVRPTDEPPGSLGNPTFEYR